MLPWLLFSLLFFPTLLLFLATRFFGHDAKKAKGLKIPPGTMGWPLVGETLAFRKPHPTTSLGDFVENHVKSYGKIFKTNLFGSPTVVSADAELNRFILLNDGRLFEPSWPKSVVEILGRTSMLVLTGDMHRLMKGMAVTFMGVPRLRARFLSMSQEIIKNNLNTWKEGTSFPVKEEACMITFDLIVKNILSMNPDEKETQELRKLYMSFMQGVVALPLYLPGTAYYKALQSRAAILKVIDKMLDERRKKRAQGTDEIGDADLLGMALDHDDLTNEEFGDLLLGLLFGGHETTSTAIVFSVYFLGQCPKAVKELREEHLKIVRSKKQRGETHELTWDDYKQMEFTQLVISETLRLGNIIQFVHRKVATDIKFKGFDIPRGWQIFPIFSAAHLDDATYDNPTVFDPWRWQRFTTAEARIKNFMPFGQGIRNCAGQELAKLEMALFIHFLVLKYDWELVEKASPLSFAFPEFHKGLPIKVRGVRLDEGEIKTTRAN